MRQAKAFLSGEGAAWYERNKERLKSVKDDPVLLAIDQYGITPKRAFEVGCADGWRLNLLRQKFKHLICGGIDPGCKVKTKTPPFIDGGTADRLSFPEQSFDLLIYGWCLYLCDPQDYLKIAYEGDRILKDSGFLIVYDFCSELPYKIPYKHKEGIFSHHYDFSKLWLCHPAYSLYGRTVQDETCVTILKKNLKDAFPVEHE